MVIATLRQREDDLVVISPSLALILHRVYDVATFSLSLTG